MQIGVVADTHGLVRPGLLRLYRRVDAILHAGDVGKGVLEALRELGPIYAVRGNNDGHGLGLPETLELTFGGRRLGLAHGHLFALKGRVAAMAAAFGNPDFVVYGHTHLNALEAVDRTVVLNPGSAGPQRFSQPVTAGLLELKPEGFRWTLHALA